MFDGIEYRGYGQEIVETLAEYSGVPVWNGLTDEFHPTQMIADLLTIRENFCDFQGLNLVFMGDAKNNVANSLMVASAKMGINFTACGPAECMPNDELVATCRAIAAENNCEIRLTSDVEEACTGANIIYTDIWSRWVSSKPLEERIRLLSPYQVNAKALSYAHDNAIFMHCLPAFHDIKTVVGAEIAKNFGITEMEVTDEVFESPASRVFDEAENRMHSIKAIMYATLSED